MKNINKNNLVKSFGLKILMAAALASASVAAYGHGSIIARASGPSRSDSK